MRDLRQFTRLLSSSLLVFAIFLAVSQYSDCEEIQINRGWRARIAAYNAELKQASSDDATGEIWKKMLADNDFGINLYAIKNLPSKFVEPNLSTFIYFALKSGFKPIRFEACTRLVATRKADLLAECKSIITKSPNSQIAIRSLDALGIIETNESFQVLKEIITTTQNFELSQYAFRVLVRNPGKIGFKVLSEIAGSDEYSPSLRVEAIGSLSPFLFEDNILFLIELLKQEDPDVIDATWATLQNITGEALLPEYEIWLNWWNKSKATFVWESSLELPKVKKATVTQKEIDNAIASGCKWLIDHQDRDGKFNSLHYSVKENYAAGKGLNDTDVCMTAMAALAFISAGVTGESEEEKARAESLDKAMNWLVTVPNMDGDYRSQNPTTYIHEQGAATWAIAEYVALGHDDYLDHLKKAVSKCMDVRDGDRVWGYIGMPGNTSNSCVTLWYGCAFAAARKAGIDLPRAGWEAIADWFDYATIEYNGYIFNASIKEPSEAMTGVGLSAKFFTMFDMSEVVSKRSAKLLLNRNISTVSYYDLYCYSYGLVNTPYPEVREYIKNIQQFLVSIQEDEGIVSGSWAPRNDIWESSRIYTAAMSIPCLTVFKKKMAMLQDPMK